jgi:hypothetical protein
VVTDQLAPRKTFIQINPMRKENAYKPILRDEDPKVNYSGEQLP